MKEFIATLIAFYSLLCGASENGTAIWNPERSAVAFCSHEGESRCYVISGENTINVSQVENANIGKLGTAKKEEYEKVVTTPVKWLKSENEILMVSFKTEAWLSGEKLSAIEPVVIKNGNYLQR